MRNEIQRRYYGRDTEETYVYWYPLHSILLDAPWKLQASIQPLLLIIIQNFSIIFTLRYLHVCRDIGLIALSWHRLIDVLYSF